MRTQSNNSVFAEIRREQNYPVVMLSVGTKVWKKSLTKAALHYGSDMQLALLTSTMQKHSQAFPLMNLSSSKTHIAQAEVIEERKEAAENADAELTDFQKRELAELDVEYVGVNRYGVPEDATATKARAKVWEWMIKSIQHSWAAPYERDSRIRKYDIAALYMTIMTNLNEGSFTQVGAKAAHLFELRLGPAGSVMEYIIQLQDRRRVIDDLGEDFKVPEKILMSMLLRAAAGHSDLREEAIKMNKEFNPADPLDHNNKVSLEGFCERLQEEQEIRQRYRLPSDKARDKVLKVTVDSDVAICYNWRDTGDCTFGDRCRFNHSGSSKPTNSNRGGGGSRGRGGRGGRGGGRGDGTNEKTGKSKGNCHAWERRGTCFNHLQGKCKYDHPVLNDTQVAAARKKNEAAESKKIRKAVSKHMADERVYGHVAPPPGTPRHPPGGPIRMGADE